jgi:UDP-N-acetylglucosamine--N-acetylmuramyl-(pentapeptide) pyrophosphoryl-undecaprenol N-acetylglucosamine transferase
MRKGLHTSFAGGPAGAALRPLLVGTVAAPTSAPLAVLTGGKSAGHVFPALAVGDELAGRGWRTAYVGLPDSMEERLASGRGIPFHPLAARPVVGRGFFDRVLALFTLLRSALAARSLMRRLGARVVVATGGFVSAPTVIGAWLARRVVVLLEPNAEPGAANRWLSRFAALAAVGHRDTGAALHCRSVHTGVPVRREFAEVPEPPVGAARRLLILGGSQGAALLNAALPSALRAHDLGVALQVLHQTGAANLESASSAYRAHFDEVASGHFSRDAISVRLAPFVDDVAAELARSHLVVSRAGAITLAELCAAGRGSLLVPLRLASGHQQANARALADAGAAVTLEEGELEELAGALAGLLSSPERLLEMGRCARSLGAPRAATEIADRIEQLVGRAAA